MFCASWKIPNNASISEQGGRFAQVFSFPREDDDALEEIFDPVYKMRKMNNSQPIIHPMNPEALNFTIKGPEPCVFPTLNYFQDLNHFLDPSCLFQENPHKFVDPDLFFEKPVMLNQDLQSDLIADTLSTFSSPFLTTPHQSDKVSETFMESDCKLQDIFADFEVSEKSEEDRPIVDAREPICFNPKSDKIDPQNILLLNLVEKVLSGESVPSDQLKYLNKFEQAIVEAVFEKKRHNPNKNRDKGRKREEEKQKFFFKGLLKFTETDFFSEATKSKKTRKRQLDRNSFYEYYWGDISRNHKIDISNFYHPGKKVSVSTLGNTTAQTHLAENRRLKSINTTFIDLVLMSESFREKASYYLDSVFVQENVSSRRKKIVKIIEKIQVVANQTMNKNQKLPEDKRVQKTINCIQDYIILNTKSKLPWSNPELFEAKDFAQAILKRQSSNTPTAF